MESLIEHRASIEGPSTPVPADLLRLSIGLEDPSDLIADLEQALDHDVRDPLPIELANQVIDLTSGSVTERIQALLALRLAPVVAERGGALSFASMHDHLVKLTLSGSPGATLPLKPQIQALLRHYIDPQIEVALITPGHSDTSSPTPRPTVEEQILSLLDEQINPALATHNGSVKLLRVRQQRCASHA